MFTGIIQGLGIVRQKRASSLDVGPPLGFERRLEQGTSIAVNGVCLTVSGLTKQNFQVDLSRETRSHTNLERLRTGMRVNLELPVAVGDGLDGHLVLGHVDTVGKITMIEGDNITGKTFMFTYPPQFSQYLTEKGSVTVDGISLTPFDVRAETFRCSVVPETIERTNLQDRVLGHQVNIEFDILAKYVRKMIPHVH
ncbi:MAG: riboflavin synthase [Candidatus Bipolaricaulota bacterium]|nr:riboflavin synthase [Candidatus Bipolaricaulota bacterium]